MLCQVQCSNQSFSALFLCVCLSVCLSACLPACPSVCLSLCLSVSHNLQTSTEIKDKAQQPMLLNKYRFMKANEGVAALYPRILNFMCGQLQVTAVLSPIAIGYEVGCASAGLHALDKRTVSAGNKNRTAILRSFSS